MDVHFTYATALVGCTYYKAVVFTHTALLRYMQQS